MSRLLILATTFLFLLFWGCSMNTIKISGKIENDVYYSPLKGFSCKVPYLLHPGEVIIDEIKENSGTISFSDDFGTLLQIYCTKIVPSENDSQNDQEKLESFLSQSVEKMFKPKYPRSSISFKKLEGDFLFATLELPNGSTLINSVTEKREDATKGIIVAIRGDFIYLVSNHKSNKDGDKLIRTPEKFKEYVYDDVIEFYNLITFY